MPQDAFTLRYLCSELDAVFKGGKVNKIIQPSSDELILTIYTGKKTERLLFNVNPASPRIGVVNEEYESPLTAPNFCMLMRKHLLSATVLGVELIGFDRIVKIDFLASGEFVDAVKKTVYVELMGRYSNVILTENGKILGGNRGINMFDNGVRPLFVGHEYKFPPVNDKKLPSDVALVEKFIGVQKENFAELLCRNVQGIAVSTANEIVNGYFANKGEKVEDSTEFFQYLNHYLYKTKLNPCVNICDGEVKDVLVYPYHTISGEYKYFDTLYRAEEYYFNARDAIKRFKSKRERLLSITNTAIKKAKKRLTAIKAKEKDALSAEENRIKGELLLANIYKIKNGEKQCVLQNYYDGSDVVISLDERLSVAKNAENYYKKYNKQKRTLSALEPQKDMAEKELSYLESVLDEITISETIEELLLVQSELEFASIIAENKGQKKNKKLAEVFCRTYLVNDYKIKVGRNNSENDKLTFTAKPEDLWLHVKDYHSSHVVIENKGKKVPDEVLLVAGEICAYYSKCRDNGKVEIVYTEKKHVRKPPKSKLGFVTYENFKSFVVKPQKHAEFLKCD